MKTIWNPPFETINTIRKITAKGGGKVPMFLDCAFLDGFPRETDRPPATPDDHNGWDRHAMKLYCIDRHKGGINGTFMDLSARKIGLKELWKLKWHKNYNTDNAWTQLDADWPLWMKKFNK